MLDNDFFYNDPITDCINFYRKIKRRINGAIKKRDQNRNKNQCLCQFLSILFKLCFIFGIIKVVYFLKLKKVQSRIVKETTNIKKSIELSIENKIDFDLKMEADDKLSLIKNLFGIEKKKVPIAFTFDEVYFQVTLVSLTSLLDTVNITTLYDIYLFTPGGFSLENKQILYNFGRIFFYNCSIKIIDLGDKFQDYPIVRVKRGIRTPAYYRLELPNLLPNISRIIYLDPDNIILRDLTALYNLDMEKNYILGFHDHSYSPLFKYGIQDQEYSYICSGVLLIDLDELRKDNVTQKFLEFMIKEKGNIDQEDQTIINAVCYKKIGLIPPEYGIYEFIITHRPESWLAHLNCKEKYDEEEIYYAIDHPSIVHYVGRKPFKERNSYLGDRPPYTHWFKYKDLAEKLNNFKFNFI